jgi:hypothetical protein
MEQIQENLEILRNGSEPGDALLGRFDADLLVTTVFRDKGREHDHVVIDPDFRTIGKTMSMEGNVRENVRFAYVAVTRAKRSIDMGPLSSFLKLAQDLPKKLQEDEHKELLAGVIMPEVDANGKVDQNLNPAWFAKGNGLPVPIWESTLLGGFEEKDDPNAPATATPRPPRARQQLAATDPESKVVLTAPEGTEAVNFDPNYRPSPLKKSVPQLVAMAGGEQPDDPSGYLEDLLRKLYDGTLAADPNVRERQYDPTAIFTAWKQSLSQEGTPDPANTALRGLGQIFDSIRGDDVNSKAVELAITGRTRRARGATEPTEIRSDKYIKALRKERVKFQRLADNNTEPTAPARVEELDALIAERIDEIKAGTIDKTGNADIEKVLTDQTPATRRARTVPRTPSTPVTKTVDMPESVESVASQFYGLKAEID